MSYVENRLKAIAQAKSDPKLAELVAKAGQPEPEPQYNLRPRFLSYFVAQYCEWVGRNWREANLRREQEEREAQT